MSKSTKPVKPVANPAEAQRQQVIRTIAMKRESYFQLILGNLLRNEAVMSEHYQEDENGKMVTRKPGIKEVIDTALEGSAYIIEKMYLEDNKEGE